MACRISYISISISIYPYIFRPISAAYGHSQARGQIGDVAASLRHSHSNAGSELDLQPTPQLRAMPVA